MVTSVTATQVTKGEHDYVYREYTGLSTDTKPTTGVFNGSTFFEMDTCKAYMFNAAAEAWVEL